MLISVGGSIPSVSLPNQPRRAALGIESCKKPQFAVAAQDPRFHLPAVVAAGSYTWSQDRNQPSLPLSSAAWGAFAFACPEILPSKYHSFFWCYFSSCSVPAQKGSKEWVKCLPHRPSHPSSLPCKRHCFIYCSENHSGLQANSGKTHSQCEKK